MKLRIFLSVIVVVIAVLTVAPVFAGSYPYKDVTPKKVGKAAYKETVYVKSHRMCDGVYDSKKLYPWEKAKRWECLTMIGNAIGDENVVVNMSDVRNANKYITSQFVRNKCIKIAKEKYGMNIQWEGDDSKKSLSRIGMIQLIYKFVVFDPAFAPRY